MATVSLDRERLAAALPDVTRSASGKVWTGPVLGLSNDRYCAYSPRESFMSCSFDVG